MLSEEIENLCDELHKKNQKYSRHDKKLTNSILLIMIFGLVGILFFLAKPADIQYATEIEIGIALIVGISFVFGIYHGLKARPLRLNEREKIIANTYNAHSYLKTYLQKGISGSQPDDLDSAKIEINSIYYKIAYTWENFAELHPIIPSLETSIGIFVKNISKLKHALNNEIVEKKEILKILEELIKFFILNKIDNFQEINTKFLVLDDVELPLSKRDKIKSIIKEYINKKSTVNLFIVHIVFIGLGASTVLILDYFKFSPEIQIIAVLPITITPIMLIWVNRLRKLLGTD